MLRTKIKIHQQGKNYNNQHHFFILNKGLNTGMPLRHHCPNCFVFFADDKEEREFYFHIFQGLWELKLFRKHLIGSVIEYIRKDDIADVVEEAVNSVNSGNRQFTDVVDTLFQIEFAKAEIEKKLSLLMELRKAIFHRYLVGARS